MERLSEHFTVGKTKVLSSLFLLIVLASCAQPPGGAAHPAGPMMPKDFIMTTVQFFLMALIVYWLLVLNPAQKKMENHDKFIKELKKNDEVMTSSGFFARVVAVKPEYITLELAPNVKVKVDPAHVKPARASEQPEQESKKKEGK